MVDDLAEVVITAPDAKWLAEFSRRLVADRLCAAAQTIEQMRTAYQWRGEIHEASEARVALRTRRELIPVIVERVTAEHPYEVPSVVALPIAEGNPAYLQWIREETRSP